MLPFAHLITFRRDDPQPVYRQLSAAIQRLVQEGKLQPGSRLPSTRHLAALLGLHRKTVVAGYEELQLQGWVFAKDRSGYYIHPEIASAPVGPAASGGAIPPIAAAPRSVPPDADSATAPTSPVRLRLDVGLPDIRQSPYRQLLAEYRSLVGRPLLLRAAGKGHPMGSERLREALAGYLQNTRGIPSDASRILITNGGQMGIYVVAAAMLSPGDVVAVAHPGYWIADEAFQAVGATVRRIPVDERGLQVGRLAEQCRREPIRAVYVIPHHHFPTTVTLPPERRMQLLALAEQYGFVIVEDDYDYDVHYASSPHLPMASFAHGGRVIYVGSLSKIISPTLRLGFVAADEQTIRQLARYRTLIDIHGDPLLENAVASLFESGEIGRHLHRTLRVYRERRDQLAVRLKRFPEGTLSYRVPDGGMAYWLSLGRFPVQAVSAGLTKRGVVCGARMQFGGDGFNHLRLGFASLTVEELDLLADTLAEVINGDF